MERVVLVGFAGGRRSAGRISLSLIILNAVVARALSLLVCRLSHPSSLIISDMEKSL